jgi:hypothetical protein
MCCHYFLHVNYTVTIDVLEAGDCSIKNTSPPATKLALKAGGDVFLRLVKRLSDWWRPLWSDGSDVMGLQPFLESFVIFC